MNLEHREKSSYHDREFSSYGQKWVSVGMHLDIYEPVLLKVGMMVEKKKELYDLILVWANIQGHRGTRKEGLLHLLSNKVHDWFGMLYGVQTC